MFSRPPADTKPTPSTAATNDCGRGTLYGILMPASSIPLPRSALRMAETAQECLARSVHYLVSLSGIERVASRGHRQQEGRRLLRVAPAIIKQTIKTNP